MVRHLWPILWMYVRALHCVLQIMYRTGASRSTGLPHDASAGPDGFFGSAAMTMNTKRFTRTEKPGPERGDPHTPSEF